MRLILLYTIGRLDRFMSVFLFNGDDDDKDAQCKRRW